jgi:hypothetical protein
MTRSLRRMSALRVARRRWRRRPIPSGRAVGRSLRVPQPWLVFYVASSEPTRGGDHDEFSRGFDGRRRSVPPTALAGRTAARPPSPRVPCAHRRGRAGSRTYRNASSSSAHRPSRTPACPQRRGRRRLAPPPVPGHGVSRTYRGVRQTTPRRLPAAAKAADAAPRPNDGGGRERS